MAWRRNLSTTGTLIARRLRPSFFHIHRDNLDEPICRSPGRDYSSPSTSINSLPRAASGSRNLLSPRSMDRQGLLFMPPPGISSSLCRYMSNASGDDSSFKIDDFCRDLPSGGGSRFRGIAQMTGLRPMIRRGLSCPIPRFRRPTQREEDPRSWAEREKKGYMSNASGDDSSFKIDDFVGEATPEKVMDVVTSQPSAMSEVALAAADSSYPVAGIEYLIGAVHSFTGLNWWASIALTTVLIRGATVPLQINQMRSTAKLSLMRRVEELNQTLRETANAPDAASKYLQSFASLFKEYGVSPFTPLKGLLMRGPIFISFFFAVNKNMAEKIPSFQTGGTLWFVNLATPDSLYILPILTALTFWIAVEFHLEGLNGTAVAGTMKKFFRVFTVLSIPVMMCFPKAMFGYWLTSNMFSLAFGLGQS
ncbi:LOW QUALITY PROTEIN: mitochondrial inner membrane protein OXA1-like [Eucalyptus grandis]|uniref:LOW QUALITY PROTEIN: mitochondrial inner membrane protein OXA1-like n=1 Tax=Eucalyptus grandis TaxID=71139 RepID=UPI00192ED18D|nr:LOW QUALITY PROTEIN: mitochondrial inner membrane protein OXA1-like [Eucalyptus grandis]